MQAHPDHLPERQRSQLAHLITNIVQAVAPEYILCFGTRLVSRQQWGCFLAGSTIPQQTTAEYDLLVIIPTRDKRQEHEVVQMCEQQGEQLDIKVNIIVYRSEATRAALDKGSFFFYAIYEHGFMLYRHTGLPLQEPLTGELPTTDTTRPTWEKENARAMQFYLTARHCLDTGRTELGVFLLHQSVQHTCMALFKSVMGYRSNTHNLIRLLSLTATISPTLTQIFPANTPEEKALLNYLHEAYSGSRYQEHYTVPADQAAILAERTKQFIETAATLHPEQPGMQEKAQPITFPITIQND
ncbi:MAG: HEPN domain-containing protein [Niastella sp.]|nr:HEPN domain-containing protein [Niastella sp.]